jgi:hypothetical protein
MRNQYVMPFNGRWAVRGEETEEITSMHDSFEEAVEAAKELTRYEDSKLFILREDGTMETEESTHVDPFPSDDVTPEFQKNDPYRDDNN